MVSMDMYKVLQLVDDSKWDEISDYLIKGVDRLVRSGIDFLVIGSNTGNKSFIFISFVLFYLLFILWVILLYLE